MMQVEKVHPLQSGLFRLKHIAERRPGLPAESTLAFYPRFVWTLIAIAARKSSRLPSHLFTCG